MGPLTKKQRNRYAVFGHVVVSGSFDDIVADISCEFDSLMEDDDLTRQHSGPGGFI